MLFAWLGDLSTKNKLRLLILLVVFALGAVIFASFKAFGLAKNRFNDLKQKEVAVITLSSRLQNRIWEVKDIVTTASITKLKLHKEYKEKISNIKNLF